MSKFLSFSTISSDSVIYVKAEETLKLNETLINNTEDDVVLCVNPFDICAPAVRHKLSRKAHQSFLRNEESNSIFYQTESLCLGVRAAANLGTNKKTYGSISDLLYNMEQKPASELARGTNNPEWITQLQNMVLDHEQKLEKNPQKKIIFYFDPEYGLPVMEEKIKELPNEWTVLQLCKGYNPDISFSNFQQIFNYNADIYISLIRYPRWEKNNFKPICIELKIPRNENIYSIMSKIRDNIYPSIMDKVLHHEGLIRIEEQFKKLIKTLKQILGPWICLFHGQHDEKLDTKIFSLVDIFCKIQRFSDRENVLISLMARKIHLLTSEDIKQGAEFISSDIKKIKLITLFLIDLKSTEKTIPNKTLPVVLIIDEYLDLFPWEMIVPSQETTRFGSLQFLIHLTEVYKDSIRNGYLEKRASVANAVINPESNLADCEKRMTGFFKEVLPDWNIIAGRQPESSEFCSILNKSDFYAYMGHGSGLQLLKGNKIAELRISGIVFLFGCSSVALNSNGFCNEMSGCHNYYHLALCPAVVGMNYIVTDNAADSFGADLLSDLISSKAGKKWKQVNKEKWRKGEIIYDGEKKEPTHDGNLLALLAKARSDDKLHKLRLRAAFNCRGLPVKIIQ